MKRILFVFLQFVIILLSGCGTDKPRDIVANKFYSDYLSIYSDFKIVSLDSSETAIKKYIVSFPNDAKAWTFYGVILIKKKNFVEAKSAFEKSIKLNSLFANGFSQLGYLYMLESKEDSAKLFLEKGISLGDSSAVNFLNLAFVCEKLQDRYCVKNSSDFLYSSDSVSNFDAACLIILYSKIGEKGKVDTLDKLLLQRGFHKMNELNSVVNGTTNKDSFLIKIAL